MIGALHLEGNYKPDFSAIPNPHARDLIQKMLKHSPEDRIGVIEALNHEFFH